MQIGVIGLSHLGTVAAACLAKHFHVKIWDTEERYKAGSEPAIEELWQNRIASGCLEVVTDPGEVMKADVVWLAIDTPLGENGADVSNVFKRATLALERGSPGTPVLVSSQLPVGSVAKLEAMFPALQFACHPENLRVGRALAGFQNPDRIIIGIRENKTYRVALEEMFKPFRSNCSILWMGVESAEMVKHAINAFLGTSIAVSNELGVLALYSGADPKEVEQGLKSDTRIGPNAYVKFGGGPGPHLTRDIKYLEQMALRLGARGAGVNWNFFEAVSASNERFGNRA